MFIIRKINGYNSFSFAALSIALLAINLLLAQQNKQLKFYAGERDHSFGLNAGKQLPPIEGFDVAGNKLSLSYRGDGRKTLLLVFSPGCRYCHENMPNWQRVVNQLNTKEYRVIAISLKSEGAKEYMTNYNLTDVPLITELSPKVRTAYGLSVTPLSVLIDADGKAEKVWAGLLQERELDEFKALAGRQ